MKLYHCIPPQDLSLASGTATKCTLGRQLLLEESWQKAWARQHNAYWQPPGSEDISFILGDSVTLSAQDLSSASKTIMETRSQFGPPLVCNKNNYILLSVRELFLEGYMSTGIEIPDREHSKWKCNLIPTQMKVFKLILCSLLSVILNVMSYLCALKSTPCFYDSSIHFATGCFPQPFNAGLSSFTELNKIQITLS